jgi:uncharacterized protein (TIGR02646 family)
MRFVDRSGMAAPDDLVEKGAKEIDDAREHYGAVPPTKGSYGFKRYKLDSVKLRLETLFHGKCAYCETFYASVHPLDVEHYRPKGAIAGEDTHRGYWWLAADWDNLLPSCIDCNRKRRQITVGQDATGGDMDDMLADRGAQPVVSTGKKDSFPLASEGTRATADSDSLTAEKPLLLNPCTDQPTEHLRYFFDTDKTVSLVLPAAATPNSAFSDADGLSQKGQTSVDVYGLNRLRLVQGRTRVLRHLEFLAGLMLDLNIMAQDVRAMGTPDAENIAFQMEGFADSVLAELVAMAEPDQPYSMMAQSWLADLKSSI